MEPAGIYIHVPFCLQKCPYCDFYSVPYENAVADAYVAGLIRAIKSHPFGNLNADTLYLGGGTPSLLQTGQIRQLLETADTQFGLNLNQAEVSMEANPGTVDRNRIYQIREAGINRISFGIQSLIPEELSALGRIHTAEQAVRSVLDAHEAGFDNISVDLMLGIPGQTKISLTKTVEHLSRLPVSHVSAYLLKIEPGTEFGRSSSELTYPDEDAAAELYLLCVDLLQKCGFEQYEISNFSKAGRQCRHNLKYWTGVPYLGLGPAAHSFIADRRFSFPRSLEYFLLSEHPFDRLCQDDPGGDFEEYAMLRLRLSAGLNLREAAQRFGIDPLKIRKKTEDPRLADLLKIHDSDTISLTPKGFLVQNAVTAYLLF